MSDLGSHAGRTRPRASKRKSAPSHARARSESPLVWLHRRRDKDGRPLITDEEFKAGERLNEDFWFAQMQPRMTSDWSAEPRSGGRRGAPGAGVELSEHVLRAKDRVTRALKAVGPELAGVLIDVCCHMHGIEDAERKAGWPQRSGKVVLNLALTRLARHYGFLSDPAERETSRGPAHVRHWGSPDYRPDTWGTVEDQAAR